MDNNPVNWVDPYGLDKERLGPIPWWVVAGGRILFEPLDWGLTIGSWFRGEFSPWHLLALAPFVSGPMVRGFGNLGEAGLVRVARETPPAIFRQGTFTNEKIGWEGNFVKGQQWATDNPLTTPGYSAKYGLPSENTGKPDWIVRGTVHGDHTIRAAPPSQNNPHNAGGGAEVLPDNVTLDWFHMPD